MRSQMQQHVYFYERRCAISSAPSRGPPAAADSHDCAADVPPSSPSAASASRTTDEGRRHAAPSAFVNVTNTEDVRRSRCADDVSSHAARPGRQRYRRLR